MILIKDRHTKRTRSSFIMLKKGNMILIKDRHIAATASSIVEYSGKYDTYKGSTPVALRISDGVILPGEL